MSKKKYDGPERRKYFRHNIIYVPQKKATLLIDHHRFDVLDLSDGGLRFINDKGIALGNRIQGTLVLSETDTREISGEIVWENDDETGLAFA
jgi:c-di-GMP-binding flagellar brake protein YcgR